MAVLLDPNVWGPKFWFVLHTLAISYPNYPNAITKKKYYDLITNLTTFIPIEEIGKDFSKMLDLYPITPYLDSKDSFVKWTHFIHNKINEKLEKPKISLNEFYFKYYEEYENSKKTNNISFIYRFRHKIIFTIVILIIFCLSIYFYNK
jgi:hypothetical protein